MYQIGQRNFNQNTAIFCQEDVFANVVSEVFDSMLSEQYSATIPL